LAQDVDRDVQSQLVTLETLATAAPIASRDYAGLYASAAKIKNIAGVDVLLRDRSGQQLMNTRMPWGTPLPRDAAEGDDQVITTKKPYISNVVIGTVARQPVYFVTVRSSPAARLPTFFI
jgi:hypothetical protein